MDQDVLFGIKGLQVYKFSFKVVIVLWELLQDSMVDIVGFIECCLQICLGCIINCYYILGMGNGQLMGLIIVVLVGKIGVVLVLLGIIYDDLVDLEYSIDLVYCQLVKWMFYDDMFKLVCKVRDDQGCLIFVLGYEQGNFGGVLDCLLNCDININQYVFVLVLGVKLIVFGDFSYYKICDVMVLILFCFNDLVYIKKGQVGFMVWLCLGGNLIDVGGVVKIFQYGVVV